MASPDPQRCLPKIGGIIKRFLPKAIPQSSASFLLNGSEFLRSKYAGELAVREEFPEAIIFRWHIFSFDVSVSVGVNLDFNYRIMLPLIF